MNIGQKVKIKKFDKLPREMQNRTYAGLAGFEGVIIDRLYSEARQAYSYKLQLTGAKTVPAAAFPEEALELVAEEAPAEYLHEIEYLDNVVLVRFYEIRDGKKTELTRGHGHILHAGAIGIAQATSYAMFRALSALQEEAVQK